MATQLDTAVADAPANTADTAADTPEQNVAAQLYADEGTPQEADTTAAAEGDDGITADDIEAVENEQPEITAPNSWSAEDAAVFKTIPPEAQEVIKRREAERDRQVYAKGQEVRKVEAEARDAVLKIHANVMNGVNTVALFGERPAEPNPALLGTGQEEHRQLFYQQQAQVLSWDSQHQQVQNFLGGLEQQAKAIENQQREAAMAQTHEILGRELGETWSEPSKRQKFLEDLEPIGGELGYSRELMGQADATDIMALKRAQEWKAKAAKWDDLQKRKMTDVRAAKQIPPKVTQPGVAGASAANQVKDTRAILYPDDVRR